MFFWVSPLWWAVWLAILGVKSRPSRICSIKGEACSLYVTAVDALGQGGALFQSAGVSTAF